MRAAPWLALACAALVPAFGWLAGHPPLRDDFDQPVADRLGGWAGDDSWWDRASWPGHSLAAVAVLAAAAAACLVAGDRRAAVLASLGASVLPAVHLLKRVYRQARPEEALADGYAYPSGHAAMAMVAFGVLAVLAGTALVRRGAPAWLRPAAVALWAAVAGFVGAARVAAGQHWPLDVLGGWALGGSYVALAWWAHRRPGGGPAAAAPPGRGPSSRGEGSPAR